MYHYVYMHMLIYCVCVLLQIVSNQEQQRDMEVREGDQNDDTRTGEATRNRDES